MLKSKKKSFFIFLISFLSFISSFIFINAQTNDTWLELFEHPELYLGGIIVVVMTITLIIAILWRKRR